METIDPADRQIIRELCGREANVFNDQICALRAHPAVQECLVKQVSQSVRWTESLRFMAAQGVDRFVEIGSGRVLSGLVKKTLKEAAIFNIEDLKSLEKTRGSLTQNA